ncbi:MAG TPA: hypothetical protein DIT13_09355 [Verrucomicrobiales bacterium]|nr:hypothetical protein [Verrucomicrobiales bacterium]HRJ07883.1 hypothetical protein [Prosthecobacter sp.]HRK15322.1 hypothetical protein [Prosthecobacter sp.]
MKQRILITTFAMVFLAGAASARADGVISDIMKKYHKAPQGEDPVCKQVSNGEGTSDQIAELLKSYEAMAKEKPEKGQPSSWEEKCAALIAAVKKLQKDPKDVSDYKKAVNCKACHDPHKG